MAESSPTTESVGPRHEPSDVQARPLMIFGGVLFAMLVVSLAAMWLLFREFSAQEAREAPPPSPLAAERMLPPPPRLQNLATQRQDLLNLRIREDAVLNHYGWADPKAGVVRIPVDRAMDLLVQRGLAVREGKK